jgi:hypothetical protein
MEADDTIAKLHLFLETLSASEGNSWEPWAGGAPLRSEGGVFEFGLSLV